MTAPDIFEQMRAEAEELGRRRSHAWIESGRGAHEIEVGRPTNREMEDARAQARAIRKDDPARLIQDRDPCFECGTRKDRYGEFGCKRWRAG